NKQNIQMSCIGVLNCSVFSEGNFTKQLSFNYCVHYICSKCFQQNDEHLYERPDKSKKFQLKTKLEKHHDDASDILKLVEKYIILVVDLDNHELQERLLIKIFLALTIFNNEIINEEIKTEKSPSKKLGKEILHLYFEVKENINYLKNLSLYEEYFNTLTKQNTLILKQTFSSVNPLKCLHCTTLKVEKTILLQLLKLENTISNNKIQAVSDLNTVSLD
ncbi:10330_t:CDS:2, partial [Cetraspora pellucida]